MTYDGYYVVKLNLTKLPFAEVIEHEDNYGNTKKGVFIPYDENALWTSDRGDIYAAYIMNPTPLKSKYSHELVCCFNAEHLAYLESLGFHGKPFVGFAKHYRKSR